MSIEVHVRVRPGVPNSVWSSAETVLYSTANPNTRYVYNRVHPQNSTNQAVFQSMEAIVHAAFDGKNVTVMAYGQTGSGKTYSMIGSGGEMGIVPRTAKVLLELAKASPGTTIQAYYTEIYNESVKDLLEPQRGELALHDAPDGGVIFDKKTVTVSSFEDFVQLQTTAERNRKYGVTNLNEHSSRSHIILTFEIWRAKHATKSVINLVDLAGSESASRANTEGMSLREGGFINKSLLTLGNVVDAIVEKRPYVPYRDAKLTRILRTCLGGSGITFILCCVNPSRDNFDQTVATLRFTQRAMRIKNDPVVQLTMPPLFTHQYSNGVQKLIQSMQESAQVEYQSGLQDAYVYCSSTVSAIVSNFQSQLSDAMGAFLNTQRLLVAHDHAMAIDKIGRQYNRLNELAKEKLKNQEALESEDKRQREVAAQMEQRKSKLRRLEATRVEKASLADTEMAGWEYHLHEALRHQIREIDLLLCAEQSRRARIQYEWVMCMERIAVRCVPALRRLVTTESNAAGSEAWLQGAASKPATLLQLQERLAQAQAELADLEAAREMVHDDVEAARQEEKQQQQQPVVVVQGPGKSQSPQPRPPRQGAMTDEEALLRYTGVPDHEIDARIQRLEAEERVLRAQAKREARRESLRQVRESLRGSTTAVGAARQGRSLRPTTPCSSPPLVIAAGVATTVGRQRNNTDAACGPKGRGRRPAGQGRLAYTSFPKERSSEKAAPAPAPVTSRDAYADGVRNALSVLDTLKTRLLQSRTHHNTRHQPRGANSRSRSRSNASRSSPPSLRNDENVDERDHVALLELLLRDKKRASRRAPHITASQKENRFDREHSTTLRSHDEEPPIGIAARRQWERQTSSPRPAVERALYLMPFNSQSPPPRRRGGSHDTANPLMGRQ